MTKPSRRYRYILFLLIFLIFTMTAATCICLPSPSYGQKRTVRVGVFELNGFYKDRGDGTPGGYGADYLNRLATLTGWSYEYVWAQNWDECVRLLREGHVDIIAPAQKTEERAEEFAFSSYSIGMESGTLLASASNDALVYEDFQAFDQMRTGYIESTVFRDAFVHYARDNGFHPRMVPYTDTLALMDALNAGSVDAALVNLFVKTDSAKMLARFGASPFYFMLDKANTSLVHELDDALQQLNNELPNYAAGLSRQYYPFINHLPFTKAELEYIGAAPVLTVGCRSNMVPVSYTDRKTGEVRGITRDILDLISSISGLKFQYTALPQGSIDYSYLTDNQIALISSVEYNPQNEAASGIKLTNPYLDSKKVFICRSDRDFDTAETISLAVATGSQTLINVINDTYPHFNVIVYEDMEECFEAVKDRKADALLQNQYVVAYYLSQPRYRDMKTIPAQSLLDQMCLSPIVNTPDGTPDGLLSDVRLVSILNKAISQLSEQDISKIIIRETAENSYVYTYGDFLYQYQYPLIAIACTLAVLGVIIAYAVLLRRKSMKMILRNEEKLRNITNNINGGVVVLAAKEELRITYANDGFLELLQFKKEEYPLIKDTDYTTYVHPDDVPALESISDMDIDSGNRISFKLRIMRKDGNYIPVLFHGTLAEHEDSGRILYCVIMDISVEEQLVEKISLEQKKYSILMNSSGDIIFEVDCSERRLRVSPLFGQIFGWNATGEVPPGDITRYLHLLKIKDEDMGQLEDMTRQMLEHKDSVETTARIMKADGNCIWCLIFQYPMFNADGELVDIIGKILDIHEEVLEKERLERQSRIDPLTGLLNKAAFFAEAGSYLEAAAEAETVTDAETGGRTHAAAGSNTAIVFIDLDNFKQINDRLGHMTGDTAIKDAARKLQVIFSSYDILARFGGDEFCVLLKEISENTLKDKLAWTVEKLKSVYSAGGIDVRTSASIGAACTNGSSTLKTLLEQADKALYSVKEHGKSQYAIYSDKMQENENGRT